jgi:hypothetical protein
VISAVTTRQKTSVTGCAESPNNTTRAPGAAEAIASGIDSGFSTASITISNSR